jgi:hypothetical protein
METPDYVLPPREAHRYRPCPETVCEGHGVKSKRFIFYNTDFSSFELQALTKFQSYLGSKHKRLKLPTYMTPEELMRMLNSAHFD